MTKQEKESYLNKKAIAVYANSAFGGLEILDILSGIEDYVVVRDTYSKTIYKVRINKKSDRDTFRISGITYDMANFLRI